MGIRVQGPDGSIVEFPDGTDNSTMSAAMAKRFGGARSVTPAAKPSAAPKPPVTVKSRQQEIQDIARRSVANADSAFTLEKTPVIGNILQTLRQSGEAASSGFTAWLPFDIGNRANAAVNRVAANVRSTLGMPAAAENGRNFQDAVRISREIGNVRRSRNTVGNVAGSVVGAVGGGAGLARTVAAGGARLVSSGSNILQTLGRGVQAVTTLQKGQRAANVARLSAGGAAYSGTDSAIDGNDAGKVASDTALGAIAAPLTVGALKGGAWLARPVTDFLGITGAKNVLRRFTNSTAEEVASRAAEFRKANNGVEPTIYEVLSPGDQQRVAKAVGIMPDAARETVAASTRQRAANMGRELQSTADNIVAPAQGARTAKIADDLAASRGTTAPTPDEIALAQQAGRSPVELQQVRSDEARNIMAPHDNVQAYQTVDELVPNAPVNKKGSVVFQETDPDISKAIRLAAGSLNITKGGISVKNVTQILERLRVTAGRGGTEGDIAQSAINHIEQQLSNDLPDAGAAIQAMKAAYAGRSRMMEGGAEGAQTRLRENVPVTDNADALAVRNAYDTAEGSTGRAMGQAAQIERRLAGTPDQVVTAANEIANSPATQQAISRNLGANEGQQIADAASSQVQSAQALARLNSDATHTQTGLGDVMKGLLALSPGSLPHTKALALSRLLQGGTSLPTKAAQGIVDTIFSQNPAQVARGLKLLNNLPDTEARLIRQTVEGLIGVQGARAIPDDVQQPLTAEEMPGEINVPDAPPEEAIPADDGSMVAEGDSPYTGALQQIYDTESPELLDLIGRVEQQESGGNQAAVSRVGATGVMQIMPGTGPEAAKLAGVPWDEQAYRSDPTYNRVLGIAYLSHLIERYDGDVEHALAAYNAGPGRVDAALSSGGDDWLAQLPDETQDYVAKIS